MKYSYRLRTIRLKYFHFWMRLRGYTEISDSTVHGDGDIWLYSTWRWRYLSLQYMEMEISESTVHVDGDIWLYSTRRWRYLTLQYMEMEISDSIRIFMTPLGDKWLLLEKSDSTWRYLTPLGEIWLHLEVSDSTWRHLIPHGDTKKFRRNSACMIKHKVWLCAVRVFLVHSVCIVNISAKMKHFAKPVFFYC